MANHIRAHSHSLANNLVIIAQVEISEHSRDVCSSRASLFLTFQKVNIAASKVWSNRLAERILLRQQERKCH